MLLANRKNSATCAWFKRMSAGRHIRISRLENRDDRTITSWAEPSLTPGAAHAESNHTHTTPHPRATNRFSMPLIVLHARRTCKDCMGRQSNRCIKMPCGNCYKPCLETAWQLLRRCCALPDFYRACGLRPVSEIYAWAITASPTAPHQPHWRLAQNKTPHAQCACGVYRQMVPATGIELVTYALRVRCSTN